jgi:5-methylthioribose kinase
MNSSPDAVGGPFVDLTHDRGALLGLLCRHGIARDGERPSVRMLAGGVSSNLFVVELASGPVCVKQALPKLKVASEWRAPVDRVFAEIDWLKAAGAVIPGHVPSVVAVDEPNHAFVMEYLPAAVYSNWKTELLAGRVDPATGREIGDLLGRVHASTAADPAIAQRFQNTGNFFALRLDPYLIEAARQHPDLSRELIGLVRSLQTHEYVLVHGDVSPKNILRGQVGAVILDAECACYGDPAFDLAFLLNHILLKSVHNPLMAAQCTALFDNILSAYRRHVSWESPQAFESRTARLLPGLMLARIDGKSPVEYLEEGRRAVARAAARFLLIYPPGSLADVREHLRSAAAESGCDG